MRSLIVEDDFTSRRIMQAYLSDYGDCDIAVNGLEAVDAFWMSWENRQPYDLICMDIMMPKLSGQDALLKIRLIEKKMGITQEEAVKVIMTTGLSEKKEVVDAYYKGGASAYFVKPFKQESFIRELQLLRLIDS